MALIFAIESRAERANIPALAVLTVLVLGPSNRVAAKSTRPLEGNIGERGRRKGSGRGRGKEKHCIPSLESGNPTGKWKVWFC